MRQHYICGHQCIIDGFGKLPCADITKMDDRGRKCLEDIAANLERGFVTADHDDHLSRFGKLGTATDRRIDQCDAMFRRHLGERLARLRGRSEEHTSELQSLMRISYAVFCLKKKKNRI